MGPIRDAAPARQFDVYYDYMCPFVYRTSVLLQNVLDSGERSIDVRWRYFSLTQVNSKDEGWTIWDAPESERPRGLLAFKAAEAARRQHDGRLSSWSSPEITGGCVLRNRAFARAIQITRVWGNRMLLGSQLFQAAHADHQRKCSEPERTYLLVNTKVLA